MLSSKFLSSTVSSLVARRSPSSALAAAASSSRAMSLLTSTPPSGSATPKALADKLQLKNPSLLKFANYINGEWVSSSRSTDATFDVQNPANDDVIAQCPDLNAEEVREAINAAEGARKSWAATTAKHRSDLLLKLVKIIDENTEDLAKIISIVRLPRPPSLFRSLPPSSDAALAFLNTHRRMESPSLTLKERSPTETASLTGAFFLLAMPALAREICPRRIGPDRRDLVRSRPPCRFAGEAVRSYGDTIPSATPGLRNIVIKQPVGVCAILACWNFPNAMIVRSPSRLCHPQ